MTPAFAARRRAEEFNSLVEGTSTEELQATRYAEQLDIVGALRETAPVEPRPEFVADLRHQLMAQATTVLTPTAAKLTVRPRHTSRERRIALAIGGFAVVSATTSMAMAAQTALPGDTLYPLKRALENASTTIRGDEDAKGATMLAHATDRLEEVEALARRSDAADADAVSDTLHAFSDQATTASDLLMAAYAEDGQEAAIERLRTFTTDSTGALIKLEGVVPEPARPALIEARQVVTLIDSAATQLCPTCGDGVAQVPEFAAASLPGLLDALGAPIALPQENTSAEPKRSGKDKPADSDTGTKQDDVDPILPVQPAPDAGTGVGTADDGGKSTGSKDGKTNPLGQLTEGLTGGGTDPKEPGSGGTLGTVLEDTVNGLGEVVGGLLGTGG